MNPLALIAGALTVAAAVVHAWVGARELRLIAPDQEAVKARETWVQALCGWHWVSVSLFGAAAVFLTIGAADVIGHELVVLTGLALYFGACGGAWLLTLLVSGRGVRRRYLTLGQWLFCLLVVGLALAAR